ncbi:MAG: GNAT family N-acetyltransferase [Methanoregula sp.]|nr:GNAT family N-acetyltransferase [Methanoregula sp.]
MFSRVLVATDFSFHSDRVLECIGGIPGLEEIVLAHVPAGGPDNDPAAGEKLKKKAAILGMSGIPVRPILVQVKAGDTADAIVSAAAQERASLIVMGARGTNLLRTLILGSVSRGVIETSTTDVLVLHFKGEDAPDPSAMEPFCKNIFFKILCPVDFSKPTADLLTFLSDLPLKREVILLHVLPVPAFDKDSDALEMEASAKLGELKSAYFHTGWVRTLVRHGDPVREIADCAQKEDVSLITISRYGSRDYATNIPLGRIAAGVAERVQRPVLVRYPLLHLDVTVRELAPAEFSLAEQVWSGYRQQKADPATDRIFAVFVEGLPAAVARCRRHQDGLEVDGVFVQEEYRNRGYARKAVQVLVSACGKETLYMHSTLDLIGFYGTFGFVPIPERELPESIRARFGFAEGNLEGADASPMKRPPG